MTSFKDKLNRELGEDALFFTAVKREHITTNEETI